MRRSRSIRWSWSEMSLYLSTLSFTIWKKNTSKASITVCSSYLKTTPSLLPKSSFLPTTDAFRLISPSVQLSRIITRKHGAQAGIFEPYSLQWYPSCIPMRRESVEYSKLPRKESSLLPRVCNKIWKIKSLWSFSRKSWSNWS